jgi:hypothetical protein
MELAIFRSAMQSATCPPLTLLWAPLSLGPSGNRVSRFRNSRCYVLGTLDIPIRDDSWLPPQGFSLFGKSGLAFPNCKDHSSTGSAISRLPIARWTTSCRDLSRWLRSLPRVPRTDGPDRLSLFQSFRCSGDRNPLSTQNPGSRYTDGSFDLRHVSPQTDGPDRSRYFET